MQVFLFFALFIALIAMVFALQNSAPVQVSFFIWRFDSTLAIVLLVALLAGALMSFFVSLPSNLRVRWTVRQQRKKISELEAALSEAEERLSELTKSTTQPAAPPGEEQEQPPSPAEATRLKLPPLD